MVILFLILLIRNLFLMFFEIIEYVKELLLELWVEISFIIDLILVFFLNDFL